MPTPAQTVIRRSVTAAALAVLVTGCSGSGEPDAKPTVSKATAVPSTAAPTTSAPSANEPLSFGDTFIFRTNLPPQGEVEVNVTASKYIQPASADFSPAEVSAGAKGDEWAALEVKLCSVKGNIEAHQNSWQLATADGARIDSEFASGGPKPEFPAGGAKLAAGDCVRGNIMFAVPKGTRPTTAVYAPASIDEPKKWTIPAK
ncbi:hypothetical protein ACWFR1_36550 [Streptomyces sp. NPDC055103]